MSVPDLLLVVFTFLVAGSWADFVVLLHGHAVALLKAQIVVAHQVRLRLRLYLLLKRIAILQLLLLSPLRMLAAWPAANLFFFDCVTVTGQALLGRSSSFFLRMRRLLHYLFLRRLLLLFRNLEHVSAVDRMIDLQILRARLLILVLVLGILKTGEDSSVLLDLGVDGVHRILSCLLPPQLGFVVLDEPVVEDLP